MSAVRTNSVKKIRTGRSSAVGHVSRAGKTCQWSNINISTFDCALKEGRRGGGGEGRKEGRGEWRKEEKMKGRKEGRKDVK